jgi:hypothetical protein
MGGKLFAPDSEGVTTEEMNTVFDEIKSKLQSIVLDINLTVNLPSKLEHRDVDILVLTNEKDFRSKAKELLKDNIIRDSTQGHQYSVLYKPNGINKQVHVDLIYTNDPKKYSSMRTYLSYNDFSNVIGILAKRLDFIYADDGFYKAFKDNKGQWHYLFITHDLKDGLKVLGFEHVLHKYDELNNVDDIVDFALSSPLVDVEMFSKLTNRERDSTRRRPASALLIQKLLDKKIKASIEDPDYFFKKLFPHKYEEIKREEDKINRELEIKKNYDGKWVIDTFQLKPGPVIGKILNHITAKFKDSLDMENDVVVKNEVDQFLRKPEIAAMLKEITYKDFFGYLLNENIEKKMLIGNRINILDNPESPFSDATEMAQFIDSCKEVPFHNIDKVVSLIDIPRMTKLRIRKHPEEISCGEQDGIVYLHDKSTDIHYFFK